MSLYPWNAYLLFIVFNSKASIGIAIAVVETELVAFQLVILLAITQNTFCAKLNATNNWILLIDFVANGQVQMHGIPNKRSGEEKKR